MYFDDINSTNEIILYEQMAELWNDELVDEFNRIGIRNSGYINPASIHYHFNDCFVNVFQKYKDEIEDLEILRDTVNENTYNMEVNNGKINNKKILLNESICKYRTQLTTKLCDLYEKLQKQHVKQKYIDNKEVDEVVNDDLKTIGSNANYLNKFGHKVIKELVQNRSSK